MLLIPTKDEEGFIPGHSLIFLLKNKVITKRTMKKVEIAAKLYELKSIIFEVELPDDDYTVKMV